MPRTETEAVVSIIPNPILFFFILSKGCQIFFKSIRISGFTNCIQPVIFKPMNFRHIALQSVCWRLLRRILHPRSLRRGPAFPARRYAANAQELVVRALSFVGVNYRRGGESPETGFDCSGLVRHVFRESLGLSSYCPAPRATSAGSAKPSGARRTAAGRPGVLQHPAARLLACRHLSRRTPLRARPRLGRRGARRRHAPGLLDQALQRRPPHRQRRGVQPGILGPASSTRRSRHPFPWRLHLRPPKAGTVLLQP
jgi:hypothetical protein